MSEDSPSAVKDKQPHGEQQEQSPQKKSSQSYHFDMQVGVWQGIWPRSICALIAVDDTTLARYLHAEQILDLVELRPADFNGAEENKYEWNKICELSLASANAPSFRSLHHFEAKKEPYLFCLAENGRQYCIYPLSKAHGFGTAEMGTLPMASTTHLVIFQYRQMHYGLAYASGSGEYCVFAMAVLLRADSRMHAVVGRGQFRRGWTDVVWKGTHHVRCTRQKFFCYNSDTGEVAFECVWVRGASTSSSICSQEHVTMAAQGEHEAESELQITLKKKGCMAIPLPLGGHVACLLYSHTALSRSGVRKGNQSTSRLPPPPSVSARAMQGVVQATSLVLQKRVFAHNEPWTHFSMLKMPTETAPDGANCCGGLLVCYSSLSGETWASSLFPSHSPVKVVTMTSDLTSDALRHVEERPVDVAHFASALPPRISPRPVPKHAPQPKCSDSASERRRTAAPVNSPHRPFANRPATSSTSLRDRLTALHFAGSDEEEEQSLLKVLEHIKTTDFLPGSEVVKLAAEELGNAETTTLPPPQRPGTARQAKPGEIPWRSSFAERELLPSSWLSKFETKWQKHVEEELPAITFTDKVKDRLTTIHHPREQYQEDQINALLKTFHKKGEEHVLTQSEHNELVQRLAVRDLLTRSEKAQKRKRKYQFSHRPSTARTKMPASEIDASVQRMSVDEILRRNAALHRQIDKLVQGISPRSPHPPLSKEEQQGLADRLTTKFIARCEDHKKHVYKEMSAGLPPPPMILPREALRESVERLHSPPPREN